MLRLPDPAAAGERLAVVPRTPGLLNVLVAGADLRGAILGDAVVRIARMHHLRVRHVHLLPEPEGEPELLSELNVTPAYATTYAGALAELGGSVDVLVEGADQVQLPNELSAGTAAYGVQTRGVPLLRAALDLRDPSDLRDPLEPRAALDLRDPLEPRAALDPLAVRLAVLEGGFAVSPYAAGPLDRLALEQADEALTRWRRQVAAWAEAPSQALSQRVRAEVLAAYDDVDPPLAIAALRRLGIDPDVSDGSRWETVAWADRLLGLDLARLVGQRPSL